MRLGVRVALSSQPSAIRRRRQLSARARSISELNEFAGVPNQNFRDASTGAVPKRNGNIRRPRGHRTVASPSPPAPRGWRRDERRGTDITRDRLEMSGAVSALS